MKGRENWHFAWRYFKWPLTAFNIAHYFVFDVSLLSFCLAKNESSKEKGDFFQLLRMKKEALRRLRGSLIDGMALKLLPLLGTIELWYACGLTVSDLVSFCRVFGKN